MSSFVLGILTISAESVTPQYFSYVHYLHTQAITLYGSLADFTLVRKALLGLALFVFFPLGSINNHSFRCLSTLDNV